MYFLKLQVDVNGVHSFTICGKVSNSRQLIKSFEYWADFMEPELKFQDVEYRPLRCDSRDYNTELSVTRVA